MTPIAPHIATFLRERLPRQRGASEHTCEAYAYAFKLLFEYASGRFKVPPSQLGLEQLDAALIMDFLDALESERGNSPSTRNARLVAIKSFMAFLDLISNEPQLSVDTREFGSSRDAGRATVVRGNPRFRSNRGRRPRR